MAKKIRKIDLDRPVLNRENLDDIIGLLVDSFYVLGFDPNDDNEETEETFKEMFDSDSLCGQYLTLEKFKETNNIERLRERIVLNILIPEMVRKYETERKTRGPHKRGIRNFFEDLTVKEYDLFHLYTDYGIKISTLANHRTIDPFKDDDDYGLTHKRDDYMWRDPPKNQ